METAETAAKPRKNRIWELDFIRGFLILLMVVDHMFITVCFFFGPEWFTAAQGDAANGLVKYFNAAVFYVNHPARAVIQPIVVMVFVTLCGLSTGFSRNNLKRGSILAIVAIIITMVTRAMPDQSTFIYFGILHMLAFCILVWSIITALTRNNKQANLIVGLAMTLLIAGLYIGAKTNAQFEFKLSRVVFVMIETEETFSMSPGDFYPLIPWSGLFYAAAALSPYLYPDKKTLLPALDGKWNKPLCFVGRHTLVVYVVHLLIIIAVLEIVGYAGFKIWFFADML